MKKILIIAILFFCVQYVSLVKASDYTTFQDITYEHNGMKMLEDFTKQDYKKHYKAMNQKRMFWGWSRYITFKNEKAYFTKETLYVIENSGTSDIEEKIKFQMENSVQKQYTVSGNIGMKAKSDKKVFELGIQQEVETEMSKEVEESSKETVEIKITVDPGTKMLIQIKGEAKITNGVAKCYRFWRNVKKGGFEVFVITTEYYSIVKEEL